MKTFLNEVVVMEDNKNDRGGISRVLKNLGFQVKILNNANSILRHTRRGYYRSYILDINMGQGREQEGLNALERLKDLNEDIFVGVLSGYPNRYRQMAEKLKVDFFWEETANTERDVCAIVSRMLMHKEDQFIRQISTIRGSLRNIITVDNNIMAYKIFRRDRKWLSEHKGYFVGFIRGIPRGKDKEKDKLLKELRSKNPRERIFMVKVEQTEEVIDMPTPLEVTDK
jgi:CheY-like chemotaxis protein